MSYGYVTVDVFVQQQNFNFTPDITLACMFRNEVRSPLCLFGAQCFLPAPLTRIFSAVGLQPRPADRVFKRRFATTRLRQRLRRAGANARSRGYLFTQTAKTS